MQKWVLMRNRIGGILASFDTVIEIGISVVFAPQRPARMPLWSIDPASTEAEEMGKSGEDFFKNLRLRLTYRGTQENTKCFLGVYYYSQTSSQSSSQPGSISPRAA